ncbi:Putative uncharacterized protein [Taphrina deformans PYCC 5710]|uniref:Senescence domain-containing protein n=1 Tax=Taphrina deformans (strain PYCC 5710 / ATCC 11124 / CBS 356.35 / IMI 108563 / JCM 9778 / NBRC 8474) TaxID=1097556 RepID=R4X9N0_TAPDE|nr:Putative uncharacterized protein [Taphrina deformans PYCC 5710]|eukprot:CCG82471.1 Putative uncharacterized protein [Taphrina deformans PYCC 5710]
MSAEKSLGSASQEVTLLLSVPNVAVSQLYEGESIPLARGILELSLIPAKPDHFLILKVNDVEIALTPDSQVFKKGDSGLYVPWEEVPGAVLAFDLSGCPTSAIETLDTYLVDLTSMPAPESGLRNQLALVDEEGKVVGGVDVGSVDASSLSRPSLGRRDSKAPVYVAIDDSGAVSVERFKDSRIVTGSQYVSSGILYGANALSSSLERGSQWINARSPATEKDVEFHPVARASTRKIHQVSNGVTYVSNRTFGYVATLAERAGGKVVGRRGPKKDAEEGGEKEGEKQPGVLAHAAYALVSVLEAVDVGGKQVLESASRSMGSVVQHRYGAQAGTMANELGDSVRNVALVYFDAKGISHRALLTKTVKGGVKARMSDGRRVVLDDDARVTTQKKAA